MRVIKFMITINPTSRAFFIAHCTMNSQFIPSYPVCKKHCKNTAENCSAINNNNTWFYRNLHISPFELILFTLLVYISKVLLFSIFLFPIIKFYFFYHLNQMNLNTFAPQLLTLPVELDMKLNKNQQHELHEDKINSTE